MSYLELLAISLSTALIGGIPVGVTEGLSPAPDLPPPPARVAMAAVPPPRFDVPTYAAVLPDEAQFAARVNAERQRNALPELVLDPILVAVARGHSREMATRGYFAHESPDEHLRTPMRRYLAAVGGQPEYLLVGENIFYCSVVGVERGHAALMNSPEHRRNILDPRYAAVGIGTYTNEAGEYWVTQVFLKRRD